MSENPSNTNMPISRIYEVIGRMYLQLLSTTEEHNKLATQLAETIQQNKVYEEMLNKNFMSPDQGLKVLAANGVTVKEAAPDEQANR